MGSRVPLRRAPRAGAARGACGPRGRCPRRRRRRAAGRARPRRARRDGGRSGPRSRARTRRAGAGAAPRGALDGAVARRWVRTSSDSGRSRSGCATALGGEVAGGAAARARGGGPRRGQSRLRGAEERRGVDIAEAVGSPGGRRGACRRAGPTAGGGADRRGAGDHRPRVPAATRAAAGGVTLHGPQRIVTARPLAPARRGERHASRACRADRLAGARRPGRARDGARARRRRVRTRAHGPGRAARPRPPGARRCEPRPGHGGGGARRGRWRQVMRARLPTAHCASRAARSARSRAWCRHEPAPRVATQWSRLAATR